ncbi:MULTISPECIES: beta-ketoacyl synthase N-terminal-like domain-containing protein [unclassified Variovorax]|uniref:thiolase C-terminal domain-containing protein n=1 Tax=unclassified Variovorax TaxID=663243 RepID=UPI001BD523C9|nr:MULTISPECIES: beta-ketoacyl synthase N-terminal-like domain-containing protein [unclassified Variovorax]
MDDVYVIGTACTAFGKFPNKSFKDLTREVYTQLLSDAGLDDGERIDSSWFGNVKMEMFKQPNIRGQVCFSELVAEGLFPEYVPMVNVEGACATGSLAFHGAWKDVLSGTADVSLAVGVEKTFIPDDPKRQYELFTGGLDQMNPEVWHEYFRRAGEKIDRPFVLNGAGGTLNMDTYAMQAAYHMAKYGTTQRQFAIAASKTHHNGSLNPLAQYQFEVSVDKAMTDREISFPLTRSMCAPIGDGAAAAILCSKRVFDTLPAAVRERAVKVRASSLANGKYRDIDEPGVSHVAARHAYAFADIAPGDIDLAEVHDATTYGEIYQPEMLGFCDFGEGGRFAESGGSAIGGRTPINTSGGLISKGHPVGATGLSMIHEITAQLRGEAGPRQVKDADIGLAENAGGTMGFDDAICAITVLQRA